MSDLEEFSSSGSGLPNSTWAEHRRLWSRHDLLLSRVMGPGCSLWTNSGRRSKMPSAVATTPMRQQTGEARLIVPRQPAVHRIGVTFLQQTMFGYPARTAGRGDLEDGGAAFPNLIWWYCRILRPPSSVYRPSSRQSQRQRGHRQRRQLEAGLAVGDPHIGERLRAHHVRLLVAVGGLRVRAGEQLGAGEAGDAADRPGSPARERRCPSTGCWRRRAARPRPGSRWRRR